MLLLFSLLVSEFHDMLIKGYLTPRLLYTLSSSTFSAHLKILNLSRTYFSISEVGIQFVIFNDSFLIYLYSLINSQMYI